MGLLQTMIKNAARIVCTPLVISVLLLAAVSWGAAAEHRLKAKLGVVPFVAKNIEAMAFTEYLTTVLLNELDNTGQFEIFERKRLESMMALEGVRSDSLTPEQMQRMGDRLGLDFLVAGNVTSQPQGMLIDLRLLGLRSQTILFTEQTRMAEVDAPRVLGKLAVKIRNAAQQGNAPALIDAVAVGPLQPPVNLEAIGSTNVIRLRWKQQNQAQVAGYLIMRSVAAEGPFNTVSTVTEPFYNDENLRLNESYYYRIACVGQGGGSSEPSAVVRGATTIAPAAPIFMNVEPALGGAVLSWRHRPFSAGDERTAPKGVRIYRRTAEEKEFLPIARAGDDPPLFHDQGLKDGGVYFYAITAFNQAGAESELSVQLSVTTPPVTSGLAATGGKVRRIPLNWQMHPFDQVSGYRLERADTKEGPYREIALLNGREQTTYLDTGLTDKTTYWYRIIALSKESGSGGASSPVPATTRDLPPAPVRVTATSGEPRRVSIKWESTAAPDDELIAYQIHRGGKGQDRLLKIAEVKAQQTWFRDDEKPLQDKTTYSYAVSAVNAGGAVSQLSTRADAVTKAVPATPLGLAAASGEPRKVTLRWSKNPEADIAEYLVYRKSDDGEFRQVHKTSENTFADTNLNNGQGYAYRIQAVDRDSLESLVSEMVTATTKPLPKAVEGVMLQDRATRRIAWSPSSQSDVKRYHIYKKSFFGGQKLATVETTAWKATEPGKLELYVTAEDADGLESEPSAVVTVE